MPRYVTRPPRAHYCEDEWTVDPLLPTLTVSDSEPVFTGLFDAKGEEVWRAPNPIGFGRDGDW